MCAMIGQFPPLIEPRDVQNILPITFSQYVSKLGNLFFCWDLWRAGNKSERVKQ